MCAARRTENSCISIENPLFRSGANFASRRRKKQGVGFIHGWAAEAAAPLADGIASRRRKTLLQPRCLSQSFPGQEKGGLAAPSLHLALPAGAAASVALAAAAFHARACDALATGAGFLLDIGSIHDVLLDYGGMPLCEG
jgi:hypothetical protein